MNLPSKNISYTQLAVYYTNPKEWWDRYIAHIPTPKTEALLFGSISHKAFEDKRYPYRKEIYKAGLEKDKERILDGLLLYLSPYDRPKEREKTIVVPFSDGYFLKMKCDGFDKSKEGIVLTEYKTGKALWTDERAQTSFQLLMYSYIVYEKFKKIPKIVLHSLSSQNARGKTFITKHKVSEFSLVLKAVKFYIECVEHEMMNPLYFNDEMKHIANIINYGNPRYYPKTN